MGSGYFSGPRPRLYGHRGAAGLAPENTLPSFQRAIADGAELLELDVHATRDGVVVVIHDPTLERTTDGSGSVRDLSFAELSRYDAGFRFGSEGNYPFRGSGVQVPALQTLLDAFPTVPLNIEIKQADPPIESLVVSLLTENRALERVLLAAEEDTIMRRIRASAPKAATSFSFGEVKEFFERCFAGELAGYEPPGLALQIPTRFGDIELVTPETVSAAHRLGLEIHVWTINDEAQMERLLALGVDGLMSDFPGRLRRVVERLRARSS